MDRDRFELIKRKHGAYASWAVWAQPTDRPKSNIGDLTVLDPDRNTTLLNSLKKDVVMLGLVVSRGLSGTLANFHDTRSEGQDYKIRHAFTKTPYYGAYMTDLIKETVELKAVDLRLRLKSDPSLIQHSVDRLFEEFDDLDTESPTLIAFGADAYNLTMEMVPANRYSRLVRVTHYSHYIAKEKYRENVLAALSK